jgi:putative ABC transport system permease protein
MLRDIRYALRLLFRNPSLAGISVLALGIGIGLTATMFSIVYAAMFRGLPFEHAERIVYMEVGRPDQPRWRDGATLHQFYDWRAQQRSSEEIAAYTSQTVNISGTEKPERFVGSRITANTFRLLRVRPMMGRDFRDGEDKPGSERVAIIAHDLWQHRFGGDPGIIGKTIRADSRTVTIVGVMPPTFTFPAVEQIWLPLDTDPLTLKRGTGNHVAVIGRLRPGSSIDAANAEMSGISKRLAKDHPDTEKDEVGIVKPFIDSFLAPEEKAMLLTMLGAVSLVLLIACGNVTNLLLSRALMRSREVGIRAALGASRWRVIMQFLAEAFVLSLAGALLGVGIANVGIRLFINAIATTSIPFFVVFKLDAPVFGFVVVLAVLSTLIAGIIPALQAARLDLGDLLKDESRGSSSFRLGKVSRALVVVEVALSCGLLVGAGLMIKSIAKLRNVDIGIPMHQLLTARVALPESTYPDSARRQLFYDALLSRLGQNARTAQATLTSAVPALGSGRWAVQIEGATYATERDVPITHMIAISPTFFQTIGLRLLEGRNFAQSDRFGSVPVVIVNDAFAKKFFNGSSAIGRRIRVRGDNGYEEWRTIVGIAPEAFAEQIGRKDRRDAIYTPLGQATDRFMSIIVRSPDATALAGDVRAAVTAIDPDLPIYFVKTLKEGVLERTWFYRVFGTLFTIFGFAALFLAAIGLYAVMSFSVRRRTREVGIRMAIGAQTRDVLRLILRQGLTQVAIGMSLGLAFAFALSNLLKMLLFDVEPHDASIFASITLVLGLTGLAACLIPALRATRVDPNEALRTE